MEDMESTSMDLISALDLGQREHVALVGAGGKTTLMFALAEALYRKGCRLISGTTTRILLEQRNRVPGTVFVSSGPGWKQALTDALNAHGHVFLGQRILPSGKVSGVPGPVADTVWRSVAPSYLVLEADGAARRPVKAPACHEPVIPGSATLVLALMGLDALDAPFGRDNVFRPDRFREITGILPGERMSADRLSRLFSEPEGLFKGTPRGARKMVFLNKLDLLNDERNARLLADRVLQDPEGGVGRVVLGSVLKQKYIPLEGKR